MKTGRPHPVPLSPQALRNAGIAASGHGFRSSFKDWAREHDVEEVLSELALAHAEGPKRDRVNIMS